MARKPYDYGEYLRNSEEDKYPLGLHEDIPMSSSYCMLISPQRRGISGGEKKGSVTCPHYLGSHCYPRRDRLPYASASRHLGSDYAEGDSVNAQGSSANLTLVDAMREISERTLDLQRELRAGAEYGIRPIGSSMSILIDQVRGPVFPTRVPSAGLTVERPLTCLQPSTDKLNQKPSLHEIMNGLPKRKHSDIYSLRDCSRETTLNGSSYYAKSVEMETNDSKLRGRRIADHTHNNDSGIGPLAYPRGRPLGSVGLERVAAPRLLKEGKHDYTHQRQFEPWVSQRWELSLAGTSSDRSPSFRENYTSDNQWRDRRRVEEAYNKHSEPEPPSSCKMIYHNSDSSEKIDISSYGGFEHMHKRLYGTCLSPFRAEECLRALDVTRSDYNTSFQENRTIDDHWRQERSTGNAYNQYSDVETSRRYKMRTFADDNLHSDAPLRSQTHDGSHYMQGYPSETSPSRTGVDRRTITGTDKDYYARIPEMKMNIDQGKEQRRFVSAYEKYPEAEPPSYRNMRSSHDYGSGRVSTSDLSIVNGWDHVLGQQSEGWVSSIRSSSPSKGKRRNHLQYDDDSVGEIEKEQSFYYENECNDQHMPWDEHSAKYGAPLRHMKPIRRADVNENGQPVLNENSEEFKQRVNRAYLRFSKSLNGNSEQKKKYKQGKSGSLSCIVCGRHPKDFVDTHSLAMHAYYSQEAYRLAEHKALYKALCVLMGWNQDMPPDNARSYQSLGLIEARAKQEDLILWPPLIIVHNTCIGKGKDGRWEGIGNQEMDKLLTELGFGSGKAKALYGREGHKGILVVKFLPTVAGLQEAERLHKYFECHKRGRKDWLHIQSSHRGKQQDNEGPDLIRIDEKTKEKKKVLYGYLGIAGDLEELDFDTKKRIVVKSKKDMEKIKGQ